MTVHFVDPLTDPRWPIFIENQQRASIFHTRGWLEATRRTYEYEPIVLTTSPPSEDLTNGVLFCSIRSWLTGRRLVSVPFADHCDLIVERPEDREAIFAVLRTSVASGDWSYFELRPRHEESALGSTFRECAIYCIHVLDLRPPLDELFRGLHRSSIQRKVQRAARERLEYEEGRSETLLRAFYRLHVQTRRRHQLPPQPINWFRNLMECLGDKFTISVAASDGRALGSMISLRHRSTLTYKYGASDSNFHKLGAMPWLFWKAIARGREEGLEEFDLGRSEPQDIGLMTFKDRLGASRVNTRYHQYSIGDNGPSRDRLLTSHARTFVSHLPDGLLIAAGRLLYKHIG